MKGKKVDRFFLIVLILLNALGLAMFISASLGLLVKSPSIFYSVIFNQLVLGLKPFMQCLACERVGHQLRLQAKVVPVYCGELAVAHCRGEMRYADVYYFHTEKNSVPGFIMLWIGGFQ